MPDTEERITLKPGKEKVLLQRHPWIFSGAIETLPTKLQNGGIAPVYSHRGALLGHAYFNQKCTITARMLSFDQEEPLHSLEKNLCQALDLRTRLSFGDKTTAYRLVNGEGDLIPGLVVDKYGDFLVVQISTLGMEKLKMQVVDLLVTHLQPRSIYEKSTSPSRSVEGLSPSEGLLFGQEVPQEVEILENGVRFLVSIKEGQKTGFFFDHREMRALVGRLAYQKRVLNGYCYSGGFSLYALGGGAEHVVSVDSSLQAIEWAKANVALNGFTAHTAQCEEMFAFLERDPLEFDLIILDPPAFAKRREHVPKAALKYRALNRITLAKMPKESLLLTSSCSHFIDETLFQQLIFQAALEAKRSVQIIGRHLLAPDHPLNVFHPEGSYLKSLLLYVR